MTTKDQAIAQALTHLTDRNTYDDQKISEAARVLRKAKAQPPTPDCRTCEYLSDSKCYCARSEHWMKKCTNGDQYKEAPKVVLWRTE